MKPYATTSCGSAINNRVVGVLADLHARGLVSFAECVAPLGEAAARAAPALDASGLRTRAAHALADAAAGRRLQRDAAARAVRQAVNQALRERASSAQVRALAEAANGGVLSAKELATLARRLVARALARGRA